jgi:hypothetical protein
MRGERSSWLNEYSVTCRVFKGRWSIRHCLKMYNDINDLKIRMSSRAKGKVTRHESMYNPCETCKVLTRHMNTCCPDSEACNGSSEKCCTEAWAV